MAYPLSPATTVLEFREDPTAHELLLLPRRRRWKWLLVLDWWRPPYHTSTSRAMAADLEQLVKRGLVHPDWETAGIWTIAQFSDRDTAMDFAVRHDERLITAWNWWP
jgi:hypothetical protein